MKIQKTEKYTQLKTDQESVHDFFEEFKKMYSKFANEHLIIDFSEKININIEELILFLKIGTQHKESGASFVIVSKNVKLNDLQDEINVVPTFTEALDILEMEAIERDLGF